MIYNPIMEVSIFFVKIEVELIGELDYSIVTENVSQPNSLVIDADLRILFMRYHIDFEHLMKV